MVSGSKPIIAVAVWGISGFFPLLAATSSPNDVARLPIRDMTDRVFVPISAGKESSHEWVGQIIDDDQGFLWFGTRDGLDRYDGYQIQHYDPSPKDSDYGVFVQECCRYSLYRDHSGKIWVGGNEALYEYNPPTERFSLLPFAPGKLQGLVRNINQDKSGTIWLATNRGLTRYNVSNGETVRFLHNENDPSTLSS